MSVSIKWIFIVSYLLLITLLTSSCSKKTSAESLKKELETVTSWAATAHMVGEAWTRGAVPTVYAQQTLKTTQEKLQEQTDTLSKSSIAIKKRQTVLKPLQQLRQTIDQMSIALEKKDRTAIATQLKQLATEEQTIRRLAKPVGEQS